MRKHKYFVSWIMSAKSNTRIGNNLITTRLKGKKLLNYIIEEVQKEIPNAIIIGIQRLD